MDKTEVIDLVANALEVIDPDDKQVEVYPPHAQSTRMFVPDYTLPLLITIDDRVVEVTLRVAIEIHEVD